MEKQARWISWNRKLRKSLVSYLNLMGTLIELEFLEFLGLLHRIPRKIKNPASRLKISSCPIFSWFSCLAKGWTTFVIENLHFLDLKKSFSGLLSPRWSFSIKVNLHLMKATFKALNNPHWSPYAADPNCNLRSSSTVHLSFPFIKFQGSASKAFIHLPVNIKNLDILFSFSRETNRLSMKEAKLGHKS